MNSLSQLNKKCLVNMPMQLDVIATTFNDLNIILDAFFDDFNDYIEKDFSILRFNKTDEWERGTMYIFGDNEDYKNRYLESPKLHAEIRYLLPFVQSNKKNVLKFEIDFGYMCEDESNVIYFQIFDKSDSNCIITDDLKQDLKQSISNLWTYGDYENSVFIEFCIDEDLTDDKIRDCARYFKDSVLNKILSKLVG